jgi:hypothetical protein
VSWRRCSLGLYALGPAVPACYWQEFSKIEHARICTTRSAKRVAKLRAEREQAGR